MIVITHVAGSSLAGQTQEVPGDSVRFGRQPGNHVIFDAQRDLLVSGHHAELRNESGQLVLRDVGSSNGTFVNGQKISGTVPVGPNDVIQFGEGGPQLRAKLPAIAAAESPPPAGKVGVGQNTLHRAIKVASSRANRRALVIGLMVLVAAGGAAFYLHGRQDKIEEALGGVRTGMDDSLKEELARHAKELEALKGKLGAGEKEVSKLIVELTKRDQLLEELRKRQDLSEAERNKLLEEAERKAKKVLDELRRAQQDLRRKKGGQEVWAELTARYEKGIFLIYQKVGGGRAGGGTAFCVRADGLLATNAHVAVMCRGRRGGKAYQNTTGVGFDVIDVKLHPGWNKRINSPDVALVKIDTKGRSLPVLPTANTKTLQNLRVGTQLGTVGFPGELNYLSIVAQRQFRGVVATFKDGWIGRMTNYGMVGTDFARRRFIQHSASVSGGTSGSPMFTRDGAVVALNNGGQIIKTSGGRVTPSASEIAYAIRVDELHDLIKRTGW